MTCIIMLDSSGTSHVARAIMNSRYTPHDQEGYTITIICTIIIIIIILSLLLLLLYYYYQYYYYYYYYYLYVYYYYGPASCYSRCPSVSGAEQFQKLLSVGPEGYMFSNNCSKSNDNCYSRCYSLENSCTDHGFVPWPCEHPVPLLVHFR